MIYNTYAICGFAALGGMLFGFDISSMSGVIGTEAYKTYFHHPTGTTQGLIISSMALGSLFGALLSSLLADRFSRKATIQAGALIFILGAALQASAQSIAHLCLGRVVGGIAIGVCSAVVPVYQAEIAPKEIRGRVVSLQQWATTWGILIQYFVQYGAAQMDGGPANPAQSALAFRVPWAVQAVPAAVLFVGAFALPRSPRWLVTRGRCDEALRVLARLHGGGDVCCPAVMAEFDEIRAAVAFDREQAVSSFRALVAPDMAKRVFLGMSIQAWSQLTGMNVCMYFIVYIMEGAKIANPLMTASIQYIINVVCTLPAILYLDKLGRRPALLTGSFLMMTFLFISGALQGAYGHEVHKEKSDVTWEIRTEHGNVSKAVIACSYLFVATFATTWGPVSWTYPAEIFPLKVRATAVSLATASNWTFNCILGFVVPTLLQKINWKMYMIFATFNGLALIHMFFAAPETKGRTLEEMDEIFNSKRPAWRTLPPSAFATNQSHTGETKYMSKHISQSTS